SLGGIPEIASSSVLVSYSRLFGCSDDSKGFDSQFLSDTDLNSKVVRVEFALSEVDDFVDNLGRCLFEKINKQFCDLESLGRCLDLLITLSCARVEHRHPSTSCVRATPSALSLKRCDPCTDGQTR